MLLGAFFFYAFRMIIILRNTGGAVIRTFTV